MLNFLSSALLLTASFVVAPSGVQALPDLTGTWILVDADTVDRGPMLSQPGDKAPVYAARSVLAFGPDFTVTRENNILRIRQVLPQVTVDRDFDVSGKPTAGRELVVNTMNTMTVSGSSITLVVKTEAVGNVNASAVTRVLTLEADGTLSCVTSGVNGRGPMGSRYKRK